MKMREMLWFRCLLNGLSVVLVLSCLLTVGSLPALAANSSLTIMQSEAPLTMDPANHTATYTGALLYPMYETLVEFDENMEVVPALATEWQHSEDGTEWTFTLRQGVAFHDGTPFNANAVKATFDRVINPENGLASYGRFSAVINRVEVINDFTVKFYLNDPYPAFTRFITMSGASIISPKAIAELGADLAHEAVGTGPYKFVKWVSGERVVMERNTKYWRGTPEVEQLVWKWSPEHSVMSMAIQTGEVDVVFPVPPAYAVSLGKIPSVVVQASPSNRVLWLALNTLYKPLSDARVRQALNYATDREGLVKSIMWGHGKPANSPVGPSDFGYDPACPASPYNIEKAKELLAEAGYGKGFNLSITVQEAEAPIAEALQGMWAKIGVNVIVDLKEYGLWADVVFSPPDKNPTQSVIASWAAGTYDADMILTPLFHTKNWAPTGANLGFYSNTRVDELLNQGASETDPVARMRIYSEAQRIIHDEGAHVSLYYVSNLVAMQKNVRNVWVQAGGMLVIRDPKIAR